MLENAFVTQFRWDKSENSDVDKSTIFFQQIAPCYLPQLL